MNPKGWASCERMFGLGCATVIALYALSVDGIEGMVIAGGAAAAAAGVGTFIGARGQVNDPRQ